MKVKYHTRDYTVGHRDGAYFEVEKDDPKSSNGKSFTAYWLTDSEGNRAPEEVYHTLEINNQLQDDKEWKSAQTKPAKYQNIMLYCGELDELCAGYCDENKGVLVALGLDEYKPDDAPFYISEDLITKWRYM